MIQGTDNRLAEFEATLEPLSMYGQWQVERELRELGMGPRPGEPVWIWPYDEVRPKLLEACDVMKETSFSARRHLGFVNPSLPGGRGTTHTMFFGMSALNPGEGAWAHRHSIAAIRFVVEGGEGLVTVVDGEVCPMEAHDLIITPGMVWHDHENARQEHAIWLDVLDFPLVHMLRAFYIEPYGSTGQPRRESQNSSPYRYPYRDALAALNERAREARSPFDGALYEYPGQDGGSTLPTLSCRLQLLQPQEETVPHRHTSSAVYIVVQGQGALVTDGGEVAFTRNDSFVLPNWREHHFVNHSSTEDLILFSVTDEPVFSALGLYREEVAGEAPARSTVPQPW